MVRPTTKCLLEAHSRFGMVLTASHLAEPKGLGHVRELQTSEFFADARR